MGKIENLPDDDELLNALNDEKYIKEAEELERKAMEGMDDFPFDPEDEQRRFRAIFEELRDRGLLTEEEEQQVFGDSEYLDLSVERYSTPEEIKKNIEATDQKSIKIDDKKREEGKRKKKSANRWKRVSHNLGKCAAVAVVVCGGIFALSMTSEANRQYVMDTVRYVSGKDVRIKVSNGDNIIIRDNSETEMRRDIKERLGIDVPIFKYKPQNMSFEGYEVYEERQCVFLYYELKDSKIILCASIMDGKELAIEGFEGDEMGTVDIAYGTLQANVYENNDDESGKITYSGIWKRENVLYRVSGDVEEEFYKILKKIVF